MRPQAGPCTSLTPSSQASLPPPASAGTNPAAPKARRGWVPSPSCQQPCPGCCAGTLPPPGGRPRSSPGTATGAVARGGGPRSGRGCSGGHCAGRRAAGPAGSCGSEGTEGRGQGGSLLNTPVSARLGWGGWFRFPLHRDARSASVTTLDKSAGGALVQASAGR